MKKLILFYLRKKCKDKFLKKKLNKLIIYDKTYKKYFYINKNGKEEIKIWAFVLKKTEFDQKFIKFLKNHIEISLTEAKNISIEPMKYNDKDIENLIGALKSLVEVYNHGKADRDIFDFVTDIFIRCLSGHYLKNGNKRFAFVYLFKILYSLGYYFFFTKGVKKNYSFYSKKIEIFTKLLENDRNMLNSKNSTRIKIKTWIYSKTILRLHWIS